jgi:hypothetical protein
VVVVVPDERAVEGDIVLVNVDDGYAADPTEKLNLSGTPTWPEPNVAVTVIAELPAVKVVAGELDKATAMLMSGAIEYTLNELPEYDSPVPLESTTRLVNVPIVGAALAATTGPIKPPKVMTWLNPGGRPVPVPAVHWIAFWEAAPIDPSKMLADPQVAPESVNEKPELAPGAIIVIEVIANALDAGLVTLTPNVVPGETPVPTIT